MYSKNDYDLAGFIGLVDKDILDKKNKKDNLLVGINSSGIHSMDSL